MVVESHQSLSQKIKQHKEARSDVQQNRVFY